MKTEGQTIYFITIEYLKGIVHVRVLCVYVCTHTHIHTCIYIHTSHPIPFPNIFFPLLFLTPIRKSFHLPEIFLLDPSYWQQIFLSLSMYNILFNFLRGFLSWIICTKSCFAPSLEMWYCYFSSHCLTKSYL